MPLQVRRGTTTDRTSITPLIGEIIYDTTQKVLYVGDGNTPGGVAANAFTFEDAQDASANLFTTGIHSNINFSYNDVAGRIDAAIDLTSYNGSISANSFKGNILDANNNVLVDATLGSFQLDGTVRSNVVPFASETYDLGSPTNKFKDLYLSGASLYLGDARITASGTAVNLPAGSTVGGSAIATSVGAGLFEGDIKGSVFGQDSSVIIDATSNQIRGNFIGNLGGDLNTNNFSIVSNGNIFISPNNYTQFGSAFAGINGNLVIRRSSYTGGAVLGNGGILFEQFHNDPKADRLIFHRSRGSYTSPQPVQTGDRIAEIAFIGNTSAAPYSVYSASIRAVAVGGPIYSPSGNVIPTDIEFRALNDPNEADTRVLTISSEKKVLANRIEGLSTTLTVIGNLIGDVTGSIFSDNSTMLVDGTNGRFIGNLDGDVTGSVYSDNSTRIIDGTDGSITAGSFVQFGSLTSAQRDALAAVNGMVIYNTTNNKFEGYQNGAWINLDNGAPAGV